MSCQPSGMNSLASGLPPTYVSSGAAISLFWRWGVFFVTKLKSPPPPHCVLPLWGSSSTNYFSPCIFILCAFQGIQIPHAHVCRSPPPHTHTLEPNQTKIKRPFHHSVSPTPLWLLSDEVLQFTVLQFIVQLSENPLSSHVPHTALPVWSIPHSRLALLRLPETVLRNVSKGCCCLIVLT